MDWVFCHQEFSIHPMAAMEIPQIAGWIKMTNPIVVGCEIRITS